MRISASQAAALIGARCPGWAVQAIEPLGEGDSFTAFLVNRAWVFRFARDEAWAVNLRVEWCLLPRIAAAVELAVPAPQIASLAELPAFSAYPLLPGSFLTRDRYLALPEGARDRCAARVGRFLAQLHGFDLEVARGCGVGPEHDTRHFAALLARARARRQSLGPMGPFVERTIGAWLAEPGMRAFQPVLLHGDVGPHHVLAAENDQGETAVTAVIDFGDLAIGDPAWDLVYIYEDYGLDFLARLVPAHGPGRWAALLERMYRFFVLDAIEWAVSSAAQGSDELDEALANLARIEADGDAPLEEIVSTCVTDRTPAG
jgi:aminoglycoside 2''-phosphotransferase